jgi:3-hydroxyisobutyrate dehydrogenase-like beta-hydroxyacid dehydrogenase
VNPSQARVALIGFGEVGTIFGRELRERVASITAYDKDRKLTLTRSLPEALHEADLVICAVTASQAKAAAAAAARKFPRGAFYVDLNSASPRTKAECAAMVNGVGGRYVEMAVMSSVPPHGLAVPMLAGGPHANAAAPLLAALGFKAEIVSDQYGVASAIKMCRSIIVKGMEAIVIESFLTARHYGVEDEVIASLKETFPGMDWEKNGDYFFQRVIRHGRRRAEEMREAAVTVEEAGLEAILAAAIAERQAWVAALTDAGAFGDRESGARWRDLVDAHFLESLADR